MKIVICGLSITSSWGNGHATTYRALVRELALRGHDVLFLERDQHWYAENRDLPNPPYGVTKLYSSVGEFRERFTRDIQEADAVILGSFTPDGVAIGDWIVANAEGVVAFYDIDTPVTVSKLLRGEQEYLAPRLIPFFDVYFSFTGGPILTRLTELFRCKRPRALYCSVDEREYYPEPSKSKKWELGYLGTYSDDRQPKLKELLIEPALEFGKKGFVVAGPQYPASIRWPKNVDRVEHLPPNKHRGFYNSVGFALNVTRDDMVDAGYSPSVRLFEAAACGAPIISDYWPGLETLFEPGKEILVAHSRADIRRFIQGIGEERRREIGEAGRRTILQRHTAAHRALELELHLLDALNERARRRRKWSHPSKIQFANP